MTSASQAEPHESTWRDHERDGIFELVFFDFAKGDANKQEPLKSSSFRLAMPCRSSDASNGCLDRTPFKRSVVTIVDQLTKIDVKTFCRLFLCFESVSIEVTFGRIRI